MKGDESIFSAEFDLERESFPAARGRVNKSFDFLVAGTPWCRERRRRCSSTCWRHGSAVTLGQMTRFWTIFCWRTSCSCRCRCWSTSWQIYILFQWNPGPSKWQILFCGLDDGKPFNGFESVWGTIKPPKRLYVRVNDFVMLRMSVECAVEMEMTLCNNSP